MMKKNLILAVETSGRVGSVAIATGRQLLAEVRLSGPMKHSAELFPAIRTLLDRFGRTPEEIEQVYISVGPGSFTGLRIAVTLAKAMRLAGSAKIVSVDTLDVIAANVTQMCHSERLVLRSICEGESEESLPHNQKSEIKNHQSKIVNRKSSIARIAPILDAKRGQFYIAVYQKQKGLCHEGHSAELSRSHTQSQSKKLRIKYKKDLMPFGINNENSCLGALVADNGLWKKILPDSLMTAKEFLEKFACREKSVWLLGDGLVYHKDEFKAEGVCFFEQEFWSPRASKVHQLGWKLALANQFDDPLTLRPNYLRPPEVTIKPK